MSYLNSPIHTHMHVYTHIHTYFKTTSRLTENLDTILKHHVFRFIGTLMGNMGTSELSLLISDFLDNLKFSFIRIKHLLVYKI